jgi:2-polyprenyl-3-methyl-5-hydroxy-6-metoxy-1,4-benzoquinol methylase
MGQTVGSRLVFVMQVAVRSIACSVCGGKHELEHFPGLLRCSSCGFITADVELSVEQLKSMYSEQYFRGEEYRDYIADRAILIRHFRERLRKLVTFVSEPGSKRLLEIGCAYGFFLQVASEGFKSVEGIDISHDAIRYAREVLQQQASEVDLLDYQPSHQFDVVCMWDTIEHLAKPGEYVAAASSLLAPGGYLAISTGDIDSFVARFRGRRWRQIHPPTHLQYFSKKTLRRLLERHQLEMVYAGSDGQFRNCDSMAYGTLMVKNYYPKVYRVLQSTGLLNFPIYVNLFDIMFVIAKKVG